MKTVISWILFLYPWAVYAIVGAGSPELPPCCIIPSKAVGEAPVSLLSEIEQSTSDITLDVLIVHTSQAEEGAGGVESLIARIREAVAEANQVFSNSQARIQLNLTHIEKVEYNESRNLDTDLNRLSAKDDSFLDSVHDLRAFHGADLVTLVVESGDRAGLAYLLTATVSGEAVARGFNVVRRGFLVGNYTFAHEIGHNLGCQHDYENAEGNGFFSFAHGYRFSTDEGLKRTVMALSPGQRIPYFSNPDLSYQGVPIGIPIGETLEAHNVKTLNTTAEIVAKNMKGEDRFEILPYHSTITEGQGPIALTVHRVGTRSQSATVELKTTARLSSNFLINGIPVSTSGLNVVHLNFAPGESEKSIQLEYLDNDRPEADERFQVMMVRTSGPVTSGNQSSVQVTVLDDDPGLFFESNPFTNVSQSESMAEVRLGRFGGLKFPMNVQFETLDATALAGTHFQPVQGRIRFDPGQTTRSINIPLLHSVEPSGSLGFYLRAQPISSKSKLLDHSDHLIILRDESAEGRGTGGLASWPAFVHPPNHILLCHENWIYFKGSNFFGSNAPDESKISRFTLEGERDTTFQPKFLSPEGTYFGEVREVLAQSDGKLIVVGSFGGVEGMPYRGLVRLHADGSVDQTWAPIPELFRASLEIALDRQDRLLIAGNFTGIRGTPHFGWIRLLQNGEVDPSFRIRSAVNGARTIRCLTVDEDGSIYAGGTFERIFGLPIPYLARLRPNGEVDTTFHLSAAIDFAQTLTPPPPFIFRSQIIAPTDAPEEFNIPARGLVLLPNPHEEEQWLKAISRITHIDQIHIQPDGKLLLVSSGGRTPLFRLNPNGSFDTSFHAEIPGGSEIHVVQYLSDGRLFVAGDFQRIGFQTAFYLARLHSDGTVDHAFESIPGASSPVQSLCLLPGDRLLVGGEFEHYDQRPVSGLVVIPYRSLPSASTIAWKYSALSVSESETDFALQAVRGPSTESEQVMRIQVMGGHAVEEADFQLPLRTVHFHPGQSLATIPLVLVNDRQHEAPEDLVLRLVHPGSEDDDTSSASNQTLRVRIEDDDGAGTLLGEATHYVSGETRSDQSPLVTGLFPVDDAGFWLTGRFDNVSGLPTRGVAFVGKLGASVDPLIRFNSTDVIAAALDDAGRLVTLQQGERLNQYALTWFGWNESPHMEQMIVVDHSNLAATLHDMAMDSENRILIGGHFESLNHQPHLGMVRLMPDGGLDESFRPALPTNTGVRSIWPVHDQSLWVELERIEDSQPAGRQLVRWDAHGTEDASFTSQFPFEGATSGLVWQSTGKILIAGDMRWKGEAGQAARPLLLVRVYPDGRWDESFQPLITGTVADGASLNVVVQSDDKILIAGPFVAVNGKARQGLARLHPDGALDESFYAHASIRGRVDQLALTPWRTLLLAGEFVSVNRMPRFGLAEVQLGALAGEMFQSRLEISWSDNGHAISIGTEITGMNTTQLETSVDLKAWELVKDWIPSEASPSKPISLLSDEFRRFFRLRSTTTDEQSSTIDRSDR